MSDHAAEYLAAALNLMTRRYSCIQGHEWEGTTSAAGTSAPGDCPVCGSPTHSWSERAQGESTRGWASADETAAAPAPAIPGHEILEVLGCGGMGVVYKAKQVQLKRLVALKMILSGALAGARERQRFRLEAEAVARLQHRHVVQIHEIGEFEGRPFFSLEYVAGGSLARKLAATPQAAKPAARLVELLAQAVHAAHQAGIVHRDLKPGNVLLAASDPGTGVPLTRADGRTEHWEPRIADFGLAKNLADDSGDTHSGQVLGTPSYMAPEQAAGRAGNVGPAADVYALGAILYELTTGRPPFKGATVLDTLEQVRTQEPVPPSRLQPSLPLDLETICLKSLHKDPARRYASAAELADDLRAFREDRPIRARPVGHVERLGRWTRRNPRLAGALALAALFLVVGAAVSLYFALEERERAQALALATAVANTKTTEAVTSARAAQASADVARKEQAAANMARDRANAEKLRARRHAYAAAINLAQKALESGMPESALELLRQQVPPSGEEDLRGFEWYFLWRLCQSQQYERWPAGTCNSLAVAGDGKTFATAGLSGGAQVWETKSGKLLTSFPLRDKMRVAFVALDSDGKTLALGLSEGHVYLADAVSGKHLAKLDSHKRGVHFLEFSRDGKLLASCDANDKRTPGNTNTEPGIVQVWDVATRKRLFILDHYGGPENKEHRVQGANRVAFSPDGKRLATAGTDDGTWQIFDAATGKPLTQPRRVPGFYHGLTFSPDGKRLATASDDRRVRIWDSFSGEEQLALTLDSGIPYGLAFSPDGKLLATGTEHGALVWDLASWQKQGFPHPGRVWEVAFADAGNTLLTVGRDSSVRRWTVPRDGGSEGCGRWFTTALGFPFDTNTVVTGQFSGAITRWDAAQGKDLESWKGPEFAAHRGPAYSLTGRNRIAAGGEKAILVWDGQDKPRTLPSPFPSPKEFQNLALAPDGSLVAATNIKGDVLVMDAVTGAEKARFRTNGGFGCVFSPDGSKLARLGYDDQKTNHVIIWDLESNAEWRRWQVPTGARDLQFSRDGKLLGTTHLSGQANLWRVDPPGLHLTLTGHLGAVNHIDFSPDGKTVATAGSDTTVRLWQTATGLELLRRGVPGAVRAGQPRPGLGQRQHLQLLGWFGEILARCHGDRLRGASARALYGSGADGLLQEDHEQGARPIH